MSLPRGMSFWHPVCLISTWFGSGLLPGAPGTWGSLAALPVAWFTLQYFGVYGLAAAGVALFALGCWTSTIYARRTRERDPSSIVVDEVAAQFLVLTTAPLELAWFLGGFLLFRVADVLKPWPASWADHSLHGGFGVMLDDVFAAVYAWAALHGLVLLLK
jgi:phosphatidylglycerophosphatase A